MKGYIMSSFDEDLKEIQDEKRRNGYYSNQPYMDNTLDTSLNNKRKDPYFDKSSSTYFIRRLSAFFLPRSLPMLTILPSLVI